MWAPMAPFDQGRNACEMVRMRELDCKGRARCGGSDLRGGQGAWVEADLVKDALEPFGGPMAHPQRVRGSRNRLGNGEGADHGSVDVQSHLRPVVRPRPMMPLELRNRRSVETRQCPVGPPQQERGSVRPCVAQLEEETALLPDHRGSPARVIRFEVDPRGNRDSTGNMEVQRVRSYRKSTRLNSSHSPTSLPGFCLQP